MNISSSVASALPAAVAANSAAFDQALAAAKASRQRTIDDDVSKVMSAPTVGGAGDLIRSSAKARLLEMAKLLQLFKKLYAMNPKAMAQAVAEMARELKQLVKDYEGADKGEMDAAGTAAKAVTSGAASDGTTGNAPAATDGATATTPPSTDPTADKLAATAATIAAGGTSLYDAVMSQVSKAVGFDGQDFLKQVRSLVKEMTETLQASRGQSMIMKGAEKTREDFKDADKAMGSLSDEMGAMQNQMDDLNPVNGLRLSTAA